MRKRSAARSLTLARGSRTTHARRKALLTARERCLRMPARVQERGQLQLDDEGYEQEQRRVERDQGGARVF